MSDQSTLLCLGVAGAALVGIVAAGALRGIRDYHSTRDTLGGDHPTAADEVEPDDACPNHPGVDRRGCACEWSLTPAAEAALADADAELDAHIHHGTPLTVDVDQADRPGMWLSDPAAAWPPVDGSGFGMARPVITHLANGSKP
jgi:hypothetical protein